MRGKTKASIEVAFQQLKDALSGAAIRTVAAISDVGAIAVAVIGDDASDTHQVHDKKRDVWVRFTDVLSGIPGVGRLYAPAGILWRAAKKGDGAHVVRGRAMDGPGGPLVIPDGGDGDTDNVVPDWFPDDAGLYDPDKVLHVHAKQAVKVDSDNDKVLVQGGGKGIARLDDTVNCGWLVITPGTSGPSSTPTVISYVGPDGPDPTLTTVPPMFVIALRGKIDGASNKAECG